MKGADLLAELTSLGFTVSRRSKTLVWLVRGGEELLIKLGCGGRRGARARAPGARAAVGKATSGLRLLLAGPRSGPARLRRGD